VLSPIELDESLAPLPLDFLGLLGDLDRDDAVPDEPSATPAVSLGDDECAMIFGRDASSDRFPFSALFRLSDPAVVAPTLTFRVPADLVHRAVNVKRAELPAYGPINPALVLPGAQQEIELGLVDRVPICRPLSVDGFRAGLSLPPGGMFGGTPLAGSLAIGYVVHLAQRWTPLGLALGDLVYSLPLAPGEQQQVAVVERTASSTVIDSETLETTEAQSFSELDDSSTDATFRSAFNEAASGSTAMQTSAESSSTAGVGGIGLAAGPIVIGGGVATSTGNSSTSGSTSTLMEGARSTTSDSAEATHAAVQRQASARRQAARTGMRLATASETDRVVTKVITNHNKARALTVQYWEVLRLFDVTTTVEGTSLVCLVPMDVVRFLPPGEPPALLTPPADRPAVLRRYAELIGHADVLARTVPARYRQGLTLITEFAGDPQAAVQGSGGDAEDVLDLSLSGRFLPFEDVNPVEVDAVVEQIEKCLSDQRYDGKTFGVISLLGSAQAKAIEKKLLDRTLPEEWTVRDLRCGDAADFQGSERDVVFLSMVATAEPSRRLATITQEQHLQRYNVAVSRAKDQLWLVHSLAASDITNPQDMRRQLLDYCYGVISRPATAGPATVSEDVIVSPFDSLFEQRVFNRIIDRGYAAVSQFEANGYRIDIVVEGAKRRLGVVCHSDVWRGPAQYERDLARERDLERCGWQFHRIRESEFYVDQQSTLARLWDALAKAEIFPAVPPPG
jgi:very-short-patch-repair endonuclease